MRILAYTKMKNGVLWKPQRAYCLLFLKPVHIRRLLCTPAPKIATSTQIWHSERGLSIPQRFHFSHFAATPHLWQNTFWDLNIYTTKLYKTNVGILWRKFIPVISKLIVFMKWAEALVRYKKLTNFNPQNIRFLPSTREKGITATSRSSMFTHIFSCIIYNCTYK